MAFVGIRELSRDTSRIIREFERSGQPVVVTREGHPIGALVPISERQVHDLVLSEAADVTRGGHASPATEGSLHSAADVARELGFAAPSEKSSEEHTPAPSHTPWVDEVVHAHLSPLRGVLSPAIGSHLLAGARLAVGLESERVLSGVDSQDHPGPREERARFIADLNAGLYVRLLSRTIADALEEQPADPELAVANAAEETHHDLSEINARILAESASSLATYEAAVKTCQAFSARLARGTPVHVGEPFRFGDSRVGLPRGFKTRLP